jgi:hypothetical protein
VLVEARGYVAAQWQPTSPATDMPPPNSLCAAMAIDKATTQALPRSGGSLRNEALKALQGVLPKQYRDPQKRVTQQVIRWNDSVHTKRTVVAAYDRAIAALPKEEATA